MIPPIFGAPVSPPPLRPLMTPRELAISATGLELVQLSRVEQALEHRADIVAHAVVRRQQVVQLLGTAFGLAARRGRSQRARQACDVFPDAGGTRTIVLRAIVR